MTVPTKAIEAAANLLHDFDCPDRCSPQAMGTFHRRAQKLLEAAAPHIAEAERQRIARAIDTEAARLDYDVTEVYDVAWPHLARFVADLLEGDPNG